MSAVDLPPSCPDLFRASRRAGRDRSALVDGRDKPGHDGWGTLALFMRAILLASGLARQHPGQPGVLRLPATGAPRCADQRLFDAACVADADTMLAGRASVRARSRPGGNSLLSRVTGDDRKPAGRGTEAPVSTGRRRGLLPPSPQRSAGRCAASDAPPSWCAPRRPVIRTPRSAAARAPCTFSRPSFRGTRPSLRCHAPESCAARSPMMLTSPMDGFRRAHIAMPSGGGVHPIGLVPGISSRRARPKCSRGWPGQARP